MSEVHPKEIARYALLNNANCVIISHNHPSGDCVPSRADKHITSTIAQGLALLEIQVLDHIIVALSNTFSFAEQGLL